MKVTGKIWFSIILILVVAISFTTCGGGGGGGGGTPSVGLPAKKVDLDGDGISDGYLIDEDKDGLYDGFDTDDDGVVDIPLETLIETPVGIDIDADGTLDGYLVDSDEDGTFDGVDTDSDGVADIPLSGLVDSDAPVYVVNPVDGSSPNIYQEITINFSESMDTTSLVLSGDLTESDGGMWSTFFKANDTLTINPATAWAAGAVRPFTVIVSDLGGNALQLDLTYDVGVFFVSKSGNDSFAGTKENPKLTIGAAITAATAESTPVMIAVSEGTYTEIVTLVEGVSLHGGYLDSNWSVSDPDANTTTIISNSSNAAVYAGDTITMATVIDGFSIIGSPIMGDIRRAIVISGGASPTIQNNTINGGNGQDKFDTVGIYITGNASPIIQNNSIYGGSNGVSYGIASFNSSLATIKNNTINGGSGSSFSSGIVSANSSLTIENNVVFTADMSSANYCLYEWNVSSDPASVRNNDLFSCSTGLYYDEGTTAITVISLVNDLMDTTISGNVSVDPSFADIDGADDDITTMDDNDWHLNAVTTASTGGLDLSAFFTTDMDGVTRTDDGAGTGWSMGAYEYD